VSTASGPARRGGARDAGRAASGHLTTGRNDPEGPALSCQNDEGSSAPTTVPGAAARCSEVCLAVDAPRDGVAGRSRSATGETLTRRHQRAERSPARRDQDGGRADDPFDRWVDRQLHALYGPVVDEPMPPRLRTLLARAGRAVAGAADDGDDGAGSDGSDGTAGEGDDGRDENGR
jgi:hypothetical protein